MVDDSEYRLAQFHYEQEMLTKAATVTASSSKLNPLPVHEFDEWTEDGTFVIWDTSDAVVLAEQSPDKDRLWRVELPDLEGVYYRDGREIGTGPSVRFGLYNDFNRWRVFEHRPAESARERARRLGAKGHLGHTQIPRSDSDWKEAELWYRKLPTNGVEWAEFWDALDVPVVRL